MKWFYQIRIKIINQLYRWFKYPHVHRKMRKYNVCGILTTIKSLINSNKSLSRFGDGEIAWILRQSHISFEKNSSKLSQRLLQVLKSNSSELEIGLPGIFDDNNIYSYKTRRFYRLFMAKIGYKILPYLNVHRQYYNTSISRVYSEIKNKKKNSKILFNNLKKIWNNKNLLIIEGCGTRLGVNNNLFTDACNICRIECPINNAFESYNKILSASINYLKGHSKTLTLLALGPTATVLSYDLTKCGFRAIDIGHVDIEYQWYLMKARNKVDIPSRYVNETHDKNGKKFKPSHDKVYLNEIIARIK